MLPAKPYNETITWEKSVPSHLRSVAGSVAGGLGATNCLGTRPKGCTKIRSVCSRSALAERGAVGVGRVGSDNSVCFIVAYTLAG